MTNGQQAFRRHDHQHRGARAPPDRRKKLSAREEKTLRMLQGVGVGLHEPLPRRGQDNPEARAELLALEIELREKVKARAAAAQPAKASAPQPQASRGKDKIVRALRRLK